MAGQLVRAGDHMTQLYLPSVSLYAKITRKITPFLRYRTLKFKLNKPIVSFTFDDFPRSALKNGARVLERENWRATFYVSAGLEGVINHHGQNFFATDLPELENKGHEIAGHTFAHMDCTQVSGAKILDDLKHNRQALKSMGVKGNIEHFAFPYGATTAKLKSLLSQEFKTLRGIKTGGHEKSADLNGLRSAGIYSDETLASLLTDIALLKHRPAWLTVFAHDICKNHSEWGCTPEDFIKVVDAVKHSGALVLPIGEAIKHLEANHG
jgi:peptidoglycan/xylan/chitin deacetylase (PgdA/CDA1 family)